MKMLRLALASCLLLAGTVRAETRAADVPRFTSTTFAALGQRFEGQPYVVAFWSIHCEPCKEEIARLARLHREFPAVPIMLVAADGPELTPQVRRMLGRYELGTIETWQFGDEAEERIRYTIDRSWRGELPRAYFFDASHGVTPVTGAPDEAWVRGWFAAIKRTAASASR